jgi:hypothetical protein
MNRLHFTKFSDRPFKGCDKFILHLLEVKSEASLAWTGEKLVLHCATGTGKLPRPEENLSVACHGDSKTTIFSPPPCHSNKQGTSPVCFSTGEAGKIAETGYKLIPTDSGVYSAPRIPMRLMDESY